MNEKRREIFFPPRDNNRFFHFPRLARAQVIRESGESAGRGGGEERRGEIAGVSVSGAPRAWRRNLLLPPSPSPSILLLVSLVRIHRIVNDPGETLAVTKRLSPPLPIILYSRSFHADFFLRPVFSSSNLGGGGEGRGGGRDWMNDFISEGGGEGSTVIFFFILLRFY